MKSTDIDLDLARRAREEFKADCKIVIEDFDVHAINKIHCVVIHVGQWVEHFKIGLGFVLEHTGEAIHHSFNRHCLNTALIDNYIHPGYLDDLKKKNCCLCKWKLQKTLVKITNQKKNIYMGPYKLLQPPYWWSCPHEPASIMANAQ